MYILQQKNDELLSFETTYSDAAYVIVSTPKAEYFDVPVSGCLYISKMNRIISLRFPKTAISVDMQCLIQVVYVIYVPVRSGSYA